MPASDRKIEVYRELADIYDRQGQAQMRDRFLVLAADTAYSAGQTQEAERLRERLLQLNPHHLLKPYDSYAEALKSPDIENYLTALRRSHPYERTEHMLESFRQKDDGASSKAGPGGSDLQVYRVAERMETPRSFPPAASKKPEPKSRSAETSSIDALRHALRSPVDGAGFELVEDGHTSGAWVSIVLATLVALGGIFLAVVTFAKPFVPRNWLP
jgi:hypothetical protein